MIKNDLAGGHYMEPYAGGSAVALYLLFNGFAKHIHINDYDPAIYDFWVSVTKFPNELQKLLWDTPVDMDQWLHWRNVLRNGDGFSQVERGFATLFINRTNRSGILKGGVIGGLKQTGNYKLDSRFNKLALANRIQKIADFSSKISIHNEDAYKLLKNCKKILPKKSLIYLDPPYYVQGRGLYRNYYDHEDHQNIANLIQSENFGRNWILSYDNVKEIAKMYKFAKSYKYNLNYSAQTVYVGSEIIIFSESLKTSKSSLPTIKLAA